MSVDHVVVYDTPDSIKLFQLLSMKGRLKLEIAGLRFHVPTGPAVRKMIGSSTRSKKKLLEELESYIAANYPVPMVD